MEHPVNQKFLDALKNERDFVFGGMRPVATKEGDDVLTALEWGGLISRHLGLGMPHNATDVADLARLKKQMIRVAFLAMCCVESIERKEAKSWEGPHPGPEVRGKQW